MPRVNRLVLPTTRAARQRGLSIVEMMVGVAIGLIVVAGSTLLVAGQLADNRRLLLESQVQQDLRATADIITRELRRASYWSNAANGVATTIAPSAANPYSAVVPDTNGDAVQEVDFVYAGRLIPEDDVITDPERLGYRLNGTVIETQLGAGNWQALTDAGTLRITRFVVTPTVQDVTLACFRACSAGATACPPVLRVRRMTVDIEAQAINDPAVRRSVRTGVRLRNDQIVGECRD